MLVPGICFDISIQHIRKHIRNTDLSDTLTSQGELPTSDESEIGPCFFKYSWEDLHDV